MVNENAGFLKKKSITKKFNLIDNLNDCIFFVSEIYYEYTNKSIFKFPFNIIKLHAEHDKC